jgi:hypothetical protein
VSADEVAIAMHVQGEEGKSGYMFAKTSKSGGVRYLSAYMRQSEVVVWYTTQTATGIGSTESLTFAISLTDGREYRVLLSVSHVDIKLTVDGVMVGSPRALSGPLADCGADADDCVLFVGQRSSRSGGAYPFRGLVKSASATFVAVDIESDHTTSPGRH